MAERQAQSASRGAIAEAVQNGAKHVVAVGLQPVEGQIGSVKACVGQKIRGGGQGILTAGSGIGVVAGGNGYENALTASRTDSLGHGVTFLSVEIESTLHYSTKISICQMVLGVSDNFSKKNHDKYPSCEAHYE
jgi:hypothetical protein